jgi:hypothetical protein
MKRNVLRRLGVFLVLALVVCFTCPPAFADVEIFLNNSSLGSYSAYDLENNFTCVTPQYSSHKCCGRDPYVYYDTYGPLLEDVLANALFGSGYDTGDIVTIRFYATSDSYDSGNIDYDDVINGLYFADPYGPGVYTPAIIALAYGDVGGPLSTTNCPRNFFGQQSPSDDVVADYVKNLDRIYIYT